MDILKSSLIAMIATLFCIWLLRPLAHHIGFVDRPGGRKRHEHDTPLIGGVAMFFGFCFALLTLEQSLQPYRGLLAGTSLLVLMGVVDDFKELRPKLRLIGQLGAALMLTAWSGELISRLGNLFFLGEIQLNLWAFPITVLFVVGFINAMNMLDGQDGLAGGVALTQLILLFIISIHQKLHGDTRMLVIIAVLLIIFLSFNIRTPWRKKASIFMGDSGVTFIAFSIAWFAIDLSQSDTTMIKPMTILWILAFPLFDLVAVCIYRVRQRKSILHADRDHFHHVLHLVGFNVELSTFLLCLMSLLLGGIGLLMAYVGIPEGWQFIIFTVALAGYLLLVKCVRDPAIKATLSGNFK